VPDDPTVVLIDLGGVLFQFDHARRLKALARVLGLPLDRADALLWRSGFSADCDAGRYHDAAAVRAQVRSITGYAGTDDDLDAAWTDAFRPDRAVLDLLTAHGPGLRLGAFTNNGPLEEEVLLRRYPEAFELLQDRFFCHRLVANKPDPAVYRQVTELLDMPVTAIRFVDDSADNVHAAARWGWHAVRYRGLPDLAGVLH
jgi:HAD superfamily hydrolase (TIGR01509 family)